MSSVCEPSEEAMRCSGGSELEVTLQQGSSSESSGSVHNEMSPLKRIKNGPSQKSQLVQRPSTKEGHGLKIVIGTSVGFGIVTTIALVISIYFGPAQVEEHGGVAADNAHCSAVGTTILKKKGSAVDAAIATTLCLGVINAQSCGIGGGGFMLVHNHKSMKTEVIDFRETAPSNPSNAANNSGGASVGIPGELRMMEYVHSKYGKLPWKHLFQPAIEIAEQGFKVNKEIDLVLKRHANVMQMKKDKYLAEVYLKQGQFKKEGDIIRRTKYAATLRKLADVGSQAFYEGEIAENIVKKINHNGGNITLEDLKNYTIKTKKPLETTFQKYTVHTVPAPSSGSILISLLNIMEGYHLKPNQYQTPLYYHRLAEAIKFAYGQQASIEDPDFGNEDMHLEEMQIINKTRADWLRSRINDSMSYSDPSHYGAELHSTPGTSHLSIIGPNEDIVSLTTTINGWFGSYLMTEDGILLNNELADFSIPDSQVENQKNLQEPKKRPRSSMVPAIVFDASKPCGKRMAVGGSNGSRIISGVAEVLINSLNFEENISRAIELPRIHSYLYPKVTLEVENISNSTMELLKQKGHDVQKVIEGINIIQAAQKNREEISAHSDSRKYSSASTY